MSEIDDFDYDNTSLTIYGPIGVTEDGVVFDDGSNDSNIVKIPVSIILAVCLIVSVVGNVCTCAVIVRDRTMRTPTNCYLFNLAITDLTTTLFIPIEIYLLWVPDSYPFGEMGCIIHILIWGCLSNCSLLTIAAFTVERYLAVSRPFLRRKLSLKSRVYKIIALNWIISGCFGVPDYYLIGILQKKEQIYCYIKTPEQLKILIGTEMFVFFIMPMTIIFVLYVLIALKIKSIDRLHKNSPVSGKQYRDKTIKMLVTVLASDGVNDLYRELYSASSHLWNVFFSIQIVYAVASEYAAVAATFFFCWFPYFLLRLMVVAPKNKWIYYQNAWRVLRYLCMVNAYIYTAVNPILYSLMSRKFSRAFKDLLKGRKSWTHRYVNTTRMTVQCSEIPLKEINLQNT